MTTTDEIDEFANWDKTGDAIGNALHQDNTWAGLATGPDHDSIDVVGVQAELPKLATRPRAVGGYVLPDGMDARALRRALVARQMVLAAVDYAEASEDTLAVDERLGVIPHAGPVVRKAAGQALPGVAVRERCVVCLDQDKLRPRVDARGMGYGGCADEVDLSVESL
ncbi:hypothetical protein BGZ61DRAFT_486541 [Ilyonectria robusta]|uniref:uncharacterized protein n=1 Tax=Ilyonectria robusta TaxID=1079257 RepID=UPI001E8E5F55|nr:uncharacterized protein BGZ61DRAFT_486541 [Ilyonectria robusta]KAH8656769.1 hypothetical protein BGZ61DRAFT_486541 [Ilyonectria robusta]